MTASSDHTDPQASWTTQQGTIRPGMKVLAADGTCIGTVVDLQGEELLLQGGSHAFVAVSQIDGIGEDGVLLARRGDATFGLGAQP